MGYYRYLDGTYSGSINTETAITIDCGFKPEAVISIYAYAAEYPNIYPRAMFAWGERSNLVGHGMSNQGSGRQDYKAVQINGTILTFWPGLTMGTENQEGISVFYRIIGRAVN